MSSFRTFSTSILGHLNPSSLALHWHMKLTMRYLSPSAVSGFALFGLSAPSTSPSCTHRRRKTQAGSLGQMVLFRLVLSRMVLVPFWADLLWGGLLHFAPFLDDILHLFGSLLILLILVAAGVGFVAGAASGYLMAGCRRVLIVRWVLDHFLLSSAWVGWCRRKLVLGPWPLWLYCSRCIVPHVT